MKRWFRHLCAPSARRLFPEPTLERITRAISAGERTHAGQLVFAVEESLGMRALWKTETPRQSAERAYSQLRVWDTAGNNGVLLYLLLADHAIEIIADRGFDGLVHSTQWQQCCERLRGEVMAGKPLGEAVENCLGELSVLMAKAMPAIAGRDDSDGLPDTPRFL